MLAIFALSALGAVGIVATVFSLVRRENRRHRVFATAIGKRSISRHDKSAWRPIAHQAPGAPPHWASRD
jgi:hypothetical protein